MSAIDTADGLVRKGAMPAPVSGTWFARPSSLTYKRDGSAADASTASLNIMIIVSSASYRTADLNVGLVASGVSAIALLAAASILFLARSDAAPCAMSSCGVAMGRILFSCDCISVIDIVSESDAVLSKRAPSRETSFVRSASLTYSMPRFVAEMSTISLNATIIAPVFSSRDADANEGFVISGVSAIALSRSSSISFPARSDTAPALMSSCGVFMGRILFSCDCVSVIDTVSESDAVLSKAAPARGTWFDRLASLTCIRDRSARERFIVELNVTVIAPVFSFRAADSKEGFVSSVNVSCAI